MSRIHPDPFRTMELFFDAMRPPARPRTTVDPALAHIREEAERFVLSAALPGVAREQLELAVGEDWIELRATRKLPVPEGHRLVRRERVEQQIERRFGLPKRIDGERVEATLRDGILTVSLPKHTSAQPRTIEIKAA